VSAYHIANGKEESLTPAGPQTLSLLMVPTSSIFADPAHVDAAGNTEEDFYLHLHLPPELDLPLPATTQIYHQPPTSYLIPRWDMGPDSGAFTRIEFPAVGTRPAVQEDVDTFETILAQCTAFLERAQPPKTGKGEKQAEAQTEGIASSSAHRSASKSKSAGGEELPPYNPADYKPGEAYAKGSASSSHQGGQIVLVDEEDGSVIGELTEGYNIVEGGGLQHGSKGNVTSHRLIQHLTIIAAANKLHPEPVQITLPSDGGHQIAVSPASREQVDMLMHPAYKKSTIVSNAAAASRLIVTTSDMISKMLQGQADSFTKKTQPYAKPVEFKPSTREHIRRINTFTGNAAGLSAKTVGSIGKVAQNLGATLAKRGQKGSSGKGFGPDGRPIEDYKPGLLNKSFMAFSTVADGIDQAARNLLGSTSSAATTVVTHKWGPEAGDITRSLGGGVKNVGLVYIDVTGVSRRAILKSVAKGMVVGRTSDGADVIVGGGDGGVLTQPDQNLKEGDSDTASYVSALDKKPVENKAFA
jgi:spartin